jgi:dihydrofolate synthase/folylpolyglutamate synthase
LTPGSRAEEILARLEHEGIKLGNERMLALLSALGDPQLRLPAVLVAGTNGKGSVSSLLAQVAREAGYKVGLYTSPHLESPAERIKVDGADIREEALAGWLELLLAESARLGLEKPTYFEALTLAAFLHFDREKVDLAVLEVGLGGRLDATNVASPLLSVVTAIGFDHEKVLGNSLAAIAGEKARVARPGRSLVAWTALPEVEAVLAGYSREIGARLESADRLVAVAALGPDGLGERVEIRSPRHHFETTTRLLGRHQQVNLALAVLAAEKLHDAGFVRVDGAAIAAGIAACTWPGRLEWQRDREGREVLIDAAHNPDGAEALAAYLEELGRPFDLLFGALGDKAVDKMLPLLARGASRVTLTRPPSPRAVDPRGWIGLLPGRKPSAVSDEPATALAHALGEAGGRPLVICGSIYLIGGLRRILRESYGFVSSISG